MDYVTREIKAYLGTTPRTAAELAESAELPIESVYQALVWLYDKGLAEIKMDYYKHKASGWVAA